LLLDRGLGVSLVQTQGQQPRVANMLVEEYLRPAAVKVGILSSHRDDHGRLVDDDPRRFGFHNLRQAWHRFFAIQKRTNTCSWVPVCFATRAYKPVCNRCHSIIALFFIPAVSLGFMANSYDVSRWLWDGTDGES
jgi:hypothetical protein